MKNFSRGIIASIFMLIISICHSFGNDQFNLNNYLKKSTSWRFTTLKKEVPLNIYFGGGNIGPEGTEVIVYMKNSAWERIGQESDLSIMNDYISKNFIVITVDFGNDKQAISPNFDKDLFQIFRAIYGYKTESLLTGLNLIPKEFRCFFLPEGYRVDTNLVYWDIQKYGAYGTLDYILKSYNEDIVPKLPGLKPANFPKDMVDRFGKPFDFTVKMDIVYPSQAKKKIPTVVYSAWQAARNPNGEPIGYLPHFAGFTTRGYAYVIMGHCYNPCVVNYFHYSKFSLDDWNGLACYTAAIRYLNLNSPKYALDTKHIGMLGHSKGEYAVTRLSDPHHERGKELVRFKGYPEGSPEPQPWQGYPSNIHVGYQSMGMGLFETQYITKDYAPTIVACGENEQDMISKKAHPAFVKRLEEYDDNYINLFMEGLGHIVAHGYDKKLGVDRYQLVHDFFDRYLKVEDKIQPVVLLVSPCDSMENVSPDAKIIIDLAPVIDSESIFSGKGIVIKKTKSNKMVEGDWKASHGGTRYCFTPSHVLNKDEQYSIAITTKVKDTAGTHLAHEKTTYFKVTAE